MIVCILFYFAINAISFYTFYFSSSLSLMKMSNVYLAPSYIFFFQLKLIFFK